MSRALGKACLSAEVDLKHTNARAQEHAGILNGVEQPVLKGHNRLQLDKPVWRRVRIPPP
jgi:hypothetical protein